jgi:hypothetical protein
MKIYKTVIWLSIVTILGEGLLLSSFDFIPIKTAGMVLGESTEAWWEQIASQRFPASYYSGAAAKTLLPEQKEQDIISSGNETGVLKKNQNKPKTNETQKDSPQEDLDKMIKFLNIQSGKNFSLIQPEESAVDVVSALINKNKRVYLKDIKKELDKIQQDLGTSFANDVP